MTVQKDFYDVLSDLFVNLAAGWFGAILIVPNFSNLAHFKGWVVLTGDAVMGILSLVIAWWLKVITKKKVKRRDYD